MNNARSFRSIAATAIFFAAAFFAACFFFAPHAHAQSTDPAAVATTTDAPPALVTTAENFATPFIVNFAKTHAWLTTIIMIVGTLRLAMKPIVSVVELYVKNTPSTADDALVDKVEHSLGWKIFYWCLDWGASVKAGSQFTATPTPPPSAPSPTSAPTA